MQNFSLHNQTRRFLLSGVLALTLGALSACGPSEPARKTDERSAARHFVFGDTTFNNENQEPDVNPHNAYAGWATLRYGIGQTLFRYTDELTIEPWLAESYRLIDPNTWKIVLKPGVTFSNGRNVTAQAVKECLAHLISSHPRAAHDLQIAEMQAQGLELLIRTKRPRPTLMQSLSDPYAAIIDMQAGITPEGLVVGTGPYLASRLQTDNYVKLRRNPNYWNGTAGFESIDVLTISDGDTLAFALQSGEIDAAYGLPYASHPLFPQDRFTHTSTPTSRTFFLHFNFQSPLTQNPVIRKAVAMAVDKERFVQNLLNGNGYIAQGPFPEQFDFSAGFAARAYDPAAAAALLEADGWTDTDGDGIREKNGQQLKLRWLTYPSRQELPLLAEAVQTSLKAVGIAVEITVTPDANRIRVQPQSWDIYASAMVTAPTGDPAYFFETHALKNASANNGRYFNEELERLSEKLARTFDAAERNAIARRMQEILIDDDAFVFCSHLKMTMISRKNIEGLKAHPTDFYEITERLHRKTP